MKRRKILGMAFKAGVYLVLTALALVYLMPFIRSLVASFMTWEQASRIPPEWIPRPFTLQAFKRIFALKLFPRWFLNTALVSVATVLSNVILCSMAGFAFARLRFPLKDALFSLLLSLMMIPAFVTIVPNYVILYKLRLVDNLLAVIIISAASVNGVYLMRQYFLSLPQELFDSAKIDGCTNIKAFFYVALPLAKPAIGALAVYQFLGAWNAFLAPLVFLKSPENFTLPVGLTYAFHRQWYVEYSPIIAGSLIAAAPTILMFVLFNKYLIRGITLTASKG